MNKLYSLEDSPISENDNHEETTTNEDSQNKIEKVLCNHCGRTYSNGIRCLGICVADNDY